MAVSLDRFTVALAQAPSEPPDHSDAVERACELAMDAGKAGARLVVLPEAFIPGYPDWIWTTPFGEIETVAALRAELLAAAINVPSEITDRLCRIAQRAGVDLVIGICERSLERDDAHLYNTLLFFNAAGSLIGRQRQLAPSLAERVIWSAGDSRTLGVYSGSVAVIGGLIGADNHLPLARYVLYAAGAEIYVAAGHGTGEAWLAALRHIACEGRVYVIGCTTAGRRAEDNVNSPEPNAAMPGVVMAPDGEIMALVADQAARLFFAQIDLARLSAARRLDPDGPLARPDVFQLGLRRPTSPVSTWHLDTEPDNETRADLTPERPTSVEL
jgi:nitrilase